MRVLALELLKTVRLSQSVTMNFALLTSASAVFDIVGRAVGSMSAIASTDQRLPRAEIALAIQLLNRLPDHPWTVHDLAQRVLLSASQLTRSFRAELALIRR